MFVDTDCPENLYHPLLHEKKDGKLMFDLSKKSKQGYTNLELRKALELGYKITKVHESYHRKEYTQGTSTPF